MSINLLPIACIALSFVAGATMCQEANVAMKLREDRRFVVRKELGLLQKVPYERRHTIHTIDRGSRRKDGIDGNMLNKQPLNYNLHEEQCQKGKGPLIKNEFNERQGRGTNKVYEQKKMRSLEDKKVLDNYSRLYREAKAIKDPIDRGERIQYLNDTKKNLIQHKSRKKSSRDDDRIVSRRSLANHRQSVKDANQEDLKLMNESILLTKDNDVRENKLSYLHCYKQKLSRGVKFNDKRHKNYRIRDIKTRRELDELRRKIGNNDLTWDKKKINNSSVKIDQLKKCYLA